MPESSPTKKLLDEGSDFDSSPLLKVEASLEPPECSLKEKSLELLAEFSMSYGERLDGGCGSSSSPSLKAETSPALPYNLLSEENLALLGEGAASYADGTLAVLDDSFPLQPLETHELSFNDDPTIDTEIFASVVMKKKLKALCSKNWPIVPDVDANEEDEQRRAARKDS